MSLKEGLSVKQADYVYSNCKNEEVKGTEPVCECEVVMKKCWFWFKSYECAILNDSELYNVHTESGEKEKRSISSTKWIMLHIIEMHYLSTE